MSNAAAHPSAKSRERPTAWLLGLHGLALLIVFPLGPQEARLWSPGVGGVALMAAAYPLAAALGGMLARRAAELPASPRALALISLCAGVPCALSWDFASLVLARMVSGLVAGGVLIATHRGMEQPLSPRAAQLSSRTVSFGLPACILIATALDWRSAFCAILAGFACVAIFGPPSREKYPRPAHRAPTEPAPWALVATASLGFVTAAYLTILSGYLVFNAGHTEWHIPVVLASVAIGGLLASSPFNRVAAKTGPRALYCGTLATAALTLAPLLALQNRIPATFAIAAIAVFLVAGALRHLALARLVAPSMQGPRLVAAHLGHTQLALHLGFGVGAFAAGRLITRGATGPMSGMPGLALAGLLATALALLAGLLAYRKA